MEDRMLEINGLARKCLHGENPRCTAACPFHMDIRALSQAVKVGDFDGGLSLMRRQLLLPGILAHICNSICTDKCVRAGEDYGLRVRALEHACLAYGINRQLPPPALRGGKVAVWGGISGLFAAASLIEKGYSVTVVGAPDCPPEIPEAYFREEMEFLKTRGACFLSEDGISLEALRMEWDAVYIGKHMPGETVDPETFETACKGVFSGCIHQNISDGDSACIDASYGKRAALSIDRYLKQVSLRANRSGEGGCGSRFAFPAYGIPHDAGSNPDGVYTKEKASEEAARCLQCSCEECMKGCIYLTHYQKHSGDCIRMVVKNVNQIWGSHYANKFIQSCNLCGGCKTRCPVGIDMGQVNLEARREMTRRKIMPPAVFHYPLQDMEFNCEEAFLAIPCKDAGKQGYLLFPGCQLPSSLPETTKRTIDFLRNRLENAGLLLSCCGAPADWAGREGEAQSVRDKIVSVWEDMGKPVIVTLCPGCYHVFRTSLPDLPVMFVSEVLDEEISDDIPHAGVYAWHDPCSTRDYPVVQESCRRLAARAGVIIRELPYNRQNTRCCGYGGLQYHTAPELSRRTAQGCTMQSGLPYLTSCGNCKDFFRHEGKETIHILEVLFGREQSGEDVDYAPFDFSARRKIRLRCRQELMTMWDQQKAEEAFKTRLVIDKPLRKKMHCECIMEDDIRYVVENAQATGRRMLDAGSGHLVAGRRKSIITYWVEYTAISDWEFVIYNCYSHRMQVQVKSL